MSCDLRVGWNRKSRPKVVSKKNGESSVHADYIFSKQNGRTVPSETERCIEKLARVPSLQITFFRGKTAAQYPACQRGASKNWREFRPCRSHFFEAKRPHSIQRVREVHRKIGESSVSVNGVPAAQYASDEKAVKKWRAFHPCS